MKRWMKYVKPYLPYFILGPICMIVEVLGEIIMPKFLSYVINYGMGLNNPETGEIYENVPGIVVWIYNVFGGENTSAFVITVMCGMVMTAILMMVGGVGGAYFGAKASVNFAADLRCDLYKHVQSFSFNNIDKFSSSSLVTRLTNDVTQMQNIINMLLRMCLRAPGMLIGAIIMAVLTRPELAVVLAVVIPIMLLTIVIIMLKSFPKFTAMQKKIDGLNSTVQENITNVRVVKSFVREDKEKDKFYAANKGLKNTGMSAMKMMIFIMPIMTLYMNLTVIAVLYFGGNMVYDGSMPVGDLSAFVTYVTQILFSLMMVAMIFMQLSRAMASARRISEVLDEKVDISDCDTSDKNLSVLRGEIEFRNVSFRYYKESEEAALDNINLKIKPGSTVGIIGSTGCGKTTLVSMIPRLYDPDDGEVYVDGRNVKDYTLFNIREGVGMVLQKNVLFSGTIEENLRWGNENASMEEIVEVSKQAQADKFINNFPKGYNTDIDQGGTNVSGGQKQRLCIARTLLKKPKIIILDDSTSAVDTATEAQIRKAFANELKDSTKIIIAQRISSVREADTIVVMNEGKITGVGTHDELMENNTEYREIYYSQMDKEDSKKIPDTANEVVKGGNIDG